jgi:pyruvate/2-oxoglutarate dehydrogenase complex dihydrolipoamide dehydrogenase (E3) component
MSIETYDLAIIGAGSAGLIAADFAVKLGARVALLERDRIGGDCTWTGCVPSKAIVHVARTAHEMRTASVFGIQAQPPFIDMVQVRAYLRSCIDHIYQGTTPEALRQKGMAVHLGAVRFHDPHTLSVGTDRIRAAKVLIATGAEPVIPPLAGLHTVPFSTYRGIFENDRLPESMTVIGGGPVGVEVAQAYQRLGTEVTLFAERVLPKEDPQAAEIVLRVLEREGLRIVPERATSVTLTTSGITVRSAQSEACCELLFVAAGRKPTLDGLHLEAAGVRFSDAGIEVNDKLQTSARSIYAAGDCLGGEQFSHLAGYQGFHAARNALLPGSNSGFPAVLPRTTFTDPEIAQVGSTAAQALGAHPDTIVSAWPIDRVDRAVCENDREGMMQLIAAPSGRLLGATIVGRRAGEAIMEIVVAIQHGLKLGDLARTIHPYPTYNSGLQLLATEMAVNHTMQGLSGAVIRAASQFTRKRARAKIRS